MNTYTQTVPSDRTARLAALDEATGKQIPNDVLQYVLLPMLDVHEVKTVHTVKLQPRDASRELKNYCRLHYGCCGVCTMNTATCICMTPPALLNVAVRLPVLVITTIGSIAAGLTSICCELCCEINCSENINGLYKFDECILNGCAGDLMPCAGADYRLYRSRCHDVAQLANQCCCCEGMSQETRRTRSPRNGPEAMLME